ncbi:MAG: DinB family protein [Bacillota bacterium]
MSTFQMLRTFVDVCPQAVWEPRFFGFPYPVWYQAYHAAYFIDYWLQDDYRGERALCMTFDSRIPPEFEHGIPPDLSISKAEMQEYITLLHAKAARFFDRLTDRMLGTEITENTINLTYLDVVCGQNRHVMYNIGYLNAILRSLNLEEADWYSYNEECE